MKRNEVTAASSKIKVKPNGLPGATQGSQEKWNTEEPGSKELLSTEADNYKGRDAGGSRTED